MVCMSVLSLSKKIQWLLADPYEYDRCSRGLWRCVGGGRGREPQVSKQGIPPTASKGVPARRFGFATVLYPKSRQPCAQHLSIADCGAGVGRVSEHLLLHHFAEVDLVEPSRHLLQTAQERLPSTSGRGGGLAGIPLGHHVVNCFCMGLQEFTPAPQRHVTEPSLCCLR